jgi:hypothetical protein
LLLLRRRGGSTFYAYSSAAAAMHGIMVSYERGVRSLGSKAGFLEILFADAGPAMVETCKEMFCIRLLFAFPILVLITAVALLVVAGFDEGFKPCPSFNTVSCPSGGGTRPIRCDKLVEFGNYCGQTMNPRVTTCCRVPCQQNFTTYFDAQGKPADCFSQPFREMPVAIAGCVLLALSLAALLLACTVCRVVPGFLDNIKYLVNGRRPATTGSNSAGQELPESTPNISSKEEA